ncbi:MAG: tetratricopeptide repeat protein, partial [Pseudomonadota bacterium]
GERCFIIGNGPSLKNTNLSLLKNEYTIGLNRIYLNFENMGFEPTFYCAANPFVIEQFGHEIDRLNSIKFLRREARDYVKNHWNTFFMERFGVFDFNMELEDLQWCEGWTVTYCAMQVAYFLGFQTVVLVGVDHSFEGVGEPNKLVSSTGADQNHFHPDYFGKDIKWQYPDLKRSETSYAVAKAVFEKNGRTILDATVGGKLQVFPKVNFEKVVLSPDSIPTYFSLNEEGEELFKSGDHVGAETLFKKAAELGPGYGTTYNNLGLCSWQSGNAAQALKYMRNALEIDPEDKTTTIICAEFLRNLGQFSHAMKLCEVYLKDNPGDTQVLRMLRKIKKETLSRAQMG